MCVCVCVCVFVSLAQACVVYVVKEVASFQGAWSTNGCGT